jgi:hypothetical protein
MLGYFAEINRLGKFIEKNLLKSTGREFLCIPYVEMSEAGLVVFCECEVIYKASFAADDKLGKFCAKTESEVTKAVNTYLKSDLAA